MVSRGRILTVLAALLLLAAGHHLLNSCGCPAAPESRPEDPSAPLPPLLPRSNLSLQILEFKERRIRARRRPPFGVQAVFVIHVPALKERRAYLDGAFASWGMDVPVFYVTDFPRDALPPDILRAYHSKDPEQYVSRSLLTSRMENPDWPASKVVPMLNVTSGIFSLALKHILIWEAVADLDLDAALVLEDDVIFLANDTVRVLDSWLGQMRPEDAAGPWSVWAGAGPQMLSTRGAVGYSANLMKHNLRRAHYGDTYLINAAAARCLLGAVPPFSLPIDWEITYGLRNVTTFWTKPRVTRQGSAKEYSSVLRDKKGEI